MFFVENSRIKLPMSALSFVKTKSGKGVLKLLEYAIECVMCTKYL